MVFSTVLITELIVSPVMGSLEEQLLAIFRMDILWGNQSAKLSSNKAKLKMGFYIELL